MKLQLPISYLARFKVISLLGIAALKFGMGSDFGTRALTSIYRA